MNDVRDTERIRTLPSDLQEIANKMLEDKFQLASQGDVVEKKSVKAPNLEKSYPFGSPTDTETPLFLDPAILDSIQVCLYEAKRNGGRPDTLYVSHPVRAALLRDKQVSQYAAYSESGLPRIMGMDLKSDGTLDDNRFVFVDNISGKVLFDSNYSNRYSRVGYPIDTKW
jgi:hypothetical protein